MQWANTSNRYGAIAKFLHWSIVILIIAQYVLAEVAEELPDGIEKLATISRHKSLGMLILGLAISGWMMSSAANYPVSFFGLFQFPAIVGPNPGAHETYEEVHEAFFTALLVVAVIHALAALYHHFWLKDDSLRRMLPFGRPRSP
jgi:cytochrome b561